MGIIWLQTKTGQLVHLPVVGKDINTPENTIKIPTSIVSKDILIQHLETAEVHIPGKGLITLDFRAPGRTGSCNRCGQCCKDCQYAVFGETVECSIRADILDIAKGCVLFPSQASDIENYPDCGFKFDMG